MNKLKVYIASPYTLGWMPDNVRLQLEAKNILMDYGFVPFAPLVNHFEEIYKHRNEHDYLEWDIEWLKVCDILLRIRSSKDGVEIPSKGADIEVQVAIENNIKVIDFKDLNELTDWAVKNSPNNNKKNLKSIGIIVDKSKATKTYNSNVTAFPQGSRLNKTLS